MPVKKNEKKRTITSAFKSTDRPFWFGIAVVALAIALSAVNPVHPGLWLAHGSWIIIGLIILICTRQRFPLTRFAYAMMALYGGAMLIGAHFTYEQEPVFAWLQESLELQRNHYDRFTHLLQGFVPAQLIREVLIRRRVLARTSWLPVVSVSMCLAASAFYELIEWWFSLLTGCSLGMQGDIWDTQWDMLMALTGGIASLSLASIHDRQIGTLERALCLTSSAEPSERKGTKPNHDPDTIRCA